MNAENLSHYEKVQLLNYFAQYLPWGDAKTPMTRGHLVSQLPQAYSKWADNNTFQVRRIDSETGAASEV